MFTAGTMATYSVYHRWSLDNDCVSYSQVLGTMSSRG